MKRLSTILLTIAALAAFASPSLAIEAKKKPGSPASASDTTVAKSVSQPKPVSNKSLLERLKKDVRESSRKPDTAKYDNYIDANNDGVDDRVHSKQSASEKRAEPVKPAERESSDDSARTRTKKLPH